MSWTSKLKNTGDMFPCDVCGNEHNMDDLSQHKFGSTMRLACKKCIDEDEERTRKKREELARKRDAVQKIDRQPRARQPSIPTTTTDVKEIEGKIDVMETKIIDKLDTISKNMTTGDNSDSIFPVAPCIRGVMMKLRRLRFVSVYDTFRPVWGVNNEERTARILFNLFLRGLLLKNYKSRFVINPETMDATIFSKLLGESVDEKEYALAVEGARGVMDSVKRNEWKYKTAGEFTSGHRNVDHATRYHDEKIDAEITELLSGPVPWIRGTGETREDS